MLTGAIDPDYQGDIGLLIHEEGRDLYLEPKEFTGCLLVLTWPVVLVNGKLQQWNKRSLRTQISQESRFALPYEVKNPIQLRCYQRVREI